MRPSVSCGPLLLLAMCQALGQSGPTIVGTAYPLTNGFLAPGQVVTLQVTGLKTVLAAPVYANTVPLPLVLSGISVTVNQYSPVGVSPASTLVSSVAAPLFSIVQSNRCFHDTPATADCMVTSITLQLPFELLANPPLNSASPYPTELAIVENGANSKGFGISLNLASVHIVTGCGLYNGACVTHADGSVVSPVSPAIAGEEVVIYALGLGNTTPRVATGAATPVVAPAPTVIAPVYVLFNFSSNAGPTPIPNLVDSGALAVNYIPDFAGLTPGQVGLYQINLRIPTTVPAVPACLGSGTYSQVMSNLTITIGSIYTTYDAAPICVVPPK